MSKQQTFECEALSARISPRQCLVNYIKAQALNHYAGTYALGTLAPCLRCERPKQIRCGWIKRP
jgi:hypothetical protein